MTTAACHGKTNIDQLKQLVDEKEREWKILSQKQTHSLLQELGEAQEHLKLEKIRFQKLKEDFEYNLGLLSDRDNELEHYEKVFQQLKANDVLVTSQLSEMKIKIDDLKKENLLVQQEKEEIQRHYQERLKSYQDEVNTFYFRKDNEVEKEKMNYENLKKELQNKIRELEEDHVFERQRVLHEFEEMSKAKQEEYKQTLEEKDVEIHSQQLKLKMVSRELDLLRSSTLQIEDSIEENKSKTTKLERELKQKEWELEDSNNMNGLRIQELENANKSLEKKMKENDKEYCRRLHDQEKLLNEREQKIKSFQETYQEMESSKHEEICKIKRTIEEFEMKLQHLHWEKNDRLKEKDLKIKSLEANLQDVSGKLSELSDARSKESVTFQLQLEELKVCKNDEKEEKERLRKELDRFKTDLKRSIDRESILQQTKVKMEIEWKKRLETRENEIYRQHDELIRTLKSSKDEVSEAFKLKEEELKNQEHLIKLLQNDKNKSVQVLMRHGLYTEDLFHYEIPVKDDDDPTNSLQDQNNQLKDVIKEMRLEMERLIQQSTNITPTHEVEDNAKEIEDLQARNFKLKIQLEKLTRDRKPPNGNKMTAELFPNSDIHSHVKELNETICYLRNEKVQMSAFLNSKDVKIRHLQKTLLEHEREKQELQLQIDNLKYNSKSHDELEIQAVRTLKERVAHLELQLEQSQSVTQAYFKGAIERNLDVVQISKQLSCSKFNQSGVPAQPSKQDNEEVDVLKSKLKTAVERIKMLTIERQKLINVGNRLRAELAECNESKQISSTDTNMKSLATKLQSKLDALEQLQYKQTLSNIREEGVTNKPRDIIVDIRNTSGDTSSIDDSTADNGQAQSDSISLKGHLDMTSSGHSSIKEVWKLLEEDNASIISKSSAKETVGDEIKIIGVPMSGKAREKPIQLKVVPTKKMAQVKSKKQKVRNYNDKL